MYSKLKEVSMSNFIAIIDPGQINMKTVIDLSEHCPSLRGTPIVT